MKEIVTKCDGNSPAIKRYRSYYMQISYGGLGQGGGLLELGLAGVAESAVAPSCPELLF